MLRALRVGAVAATLVLLGTPILLGRPESPRTRGDRPNVLIILTDDQRAGTMGVMPKTMDAFAKEGTKFKNAVVTTPRCCPSRASIFSGLYVHNHGVKTNSTDPFDPTRTLQRELGEAGYATAITGKYLSGPVTHPPYFDRWAVRVGQPGRNDYIDPLFNVDGRQRRPGMYSTAYVGKKAIDFLEDFEQRDETPWFMEVSTRAPHAPSVPEPRYADAPVTPWKDTPATRERDLADKPAYVRDKPTKTRSRSRERTKHLRTLMSVDDMVGAIFARLEGLGEADGTLAFYVSDNGTLWSEHGLEGKRLPYEEAVRVPFFLRWPGHVPAGATDNSVVANIDIAPTVYEAAGVSPGYVVDGKSLFSSERSYVLLESFADSRKDDVPGWRALWKPRTVYIRYDDGAREHYSATDPWQLHNTYRDGVVGNEPSNQAQLDSRLARAANCSGEACP